METFGTRLEKFRKRKGYEDQSPFARVCNLKPQNIQLWESGTVPTIKLANKIKVAFPDLNMDYLYHGTEPMLLPTNGSDNEDKKVSILEEKISFLETENRLRQLLETERQLRVEFEKRALIAEKDSEILKEKLKSLSANRLKQNIA